MGRPGTLLVYGCQSFWGDLFGDVEEAGVVLDDGEALVTTGDDLEFDADAGAARAAFFPAEDGVEAEEIAEAVGEIDSGFNDHPHTQVFGFHACAPSH